MIKDLLTEHRKRKLFAFTLAEVLITLGIIGIIATLTIPNLIQRQEDKAAVVALKREASILQQAITLAKSDEGTIDSWYSGTDPAAALNAANAVLSNHLKVIKNCGIDPGCLPPTYKKISDAYTGTLDYDNNTSYSKMQLADGSLLLFWVNTVGYPYINTIGFSIDINGLKGPNRLGYDLFEFSVYSEAYMPSQGQMLRPSGNRTGALNATGCSVTATADTKGGKYCAAWAFYQENRDYLHCDDLNWQTKVNCS